MGNFRMNQNVLIGQVVGFLRSQGCTVWRHENGGRFDEAAALERLTELMFALAHVNYSKDKISGLISDVLKKMYRPVPNGWKGVPDVVGFMPDGRALFVECKVGTDQLRPEQVEFIDKARAAGASVWVVREIGSFRNGWFRAKELAAALG